MGTDKGETMATGTETRVRYALQLWDTEELIAAIACVRRGTWLARQMANELVARGIDHGGRWVGPAHAATLWVGADR